MIPRVARDDPQSNACNLNVISPDATQPPPSRWRLDAKQRRELLISIGLTLVAFLPFLNKPVHLDDPMYVWVAQQIRTSPADFFGFDANWYGELHPAVEDNQNPPGIGYFLAAVQAIVGESEIAMHAGMLLWSCGAIAGVYLLALRFTRRALIVTIATLVSPAFFLSATTLMADMQMFCLFIWGIVLFERALPDRANRRASVPVLLAAAACIALSALTKYFGLSLVPLLTVYAGMRCWTLKCRRPATLVAIAIALLLPVLAIVAFNQYTVHRYGTALVSDAASYATSSEFRESTRYVSSLMTGLSYLGGLMLGAAALLLARRPLMTLAVFAVLAVMSFGVMRTAHISPQPTGQPTVDPLATPQFVVFAAIGAGILLAMVFDVARRRDAQSALLLLWVLGSLAFVTFLNWSITSRTLIVLVPPTCIIAARRLDDAEAEQVLAAKPISVGGLVVAALISLALSTADYRWAVANKRAAMALTKKYRADGATVWFVGHWGFQYYAQRAGGVAMEYDRLDLRPGEHVLSPEINSNIRPPSQRIATVVEEVSVPPVWPTLMSNEAAAGFYSSAWGKLPYSLTSTSADHFTVYRIDRRAISKELIK